MIALRKWVGALKTHLKHLPVQRWMVIKMGVISREALKLHDEVRDNYPLTYEYAKNIARRCQIPMGKVFMDFATLLKVMVAREKEKMDGDGNEP